MPDLYRPQITPIIVWQVSLGKCRPQIMEGGMDDMGGRHAAEVEGPRDDGEPQRLASRMMHNVLLSSPHCCSVMRVRLGSWISEGA